MEKQRSDDECEDTSTVWLNVGVRHDSCVDHVLWLSGMQCAVCIRWVSCVCFCRRTKRAEVDQEWSDHPQARHRALTVGVKVDLCARFFPWECCV